MKKLFARRKNPSLLDTLPFIKQGLIYLALGMFLDFPEDPQQYTVYESLWEGKTAQHSSPRHTEVRQTGEDVRGAVLQLTHSPEPFCSPPAAKDRHHTQQDLADVLPVSISTVRSWENEKSALSHEMLVRFCRLYHVSSDYLLGLTRIERPEEFAREALAQIRQFEAFF